MTVKKTFSQITADKPEQQVLDLFRLLEPSTGFYLEHHICEDEETLPAHFIRSEAAPEYRLEVWWEEDDNGLHLSLYVGESQRIYADRFAFFTETALIDWCAPTAIDAEFQVFCIALAMMRRY